MKTLNSYVQGVLANFRDRRVLRKIERLIQQIMAHKTLKLWTLAADPQEFARFKSVVDGSLKSELTVAELRPELHAESVAALGDQKRVYVLHDPCDIRKPYMNQAEYLGRVRDLDGQIVPGYSTFNTVALSPTDATLRLMDITVYSNRDPHYVRVEEMQQFEKQKLQQSPDAVLRARADEIASYREEESYVNLPTIARAQLQRVSQAFKAHNPNLILRHVLDRQFDGLPYFKFVDQELQDEFVIRVKVSRNSNVATEDAETQRVQAVKLLHVDFAHHQRFKLDKLKLHGQVYQQATCDVEWDTLTLEDQTYTVIRVTLRDRQGQALFKHPMLLISNIVVHTGSQARELYLTYLQRARIEEVFKFLKAEIGWEKFQVQDYNSIRNLLALGYFVGSYFYTLDATVSEPPPLLRYLAQLGGGKGRVTRHYLAAGIRQVLSYCHVVQFLQEQVPDATMIPKILSFVT